MLIGARDDAVPVLYPLHDHCMTVAGLRWYDPVFDTAQYWGKCDDKVFARSIPYVTLKGHDRSNLENIGVPLDAVWQHRHGSFYLLINRFSGVSQFQTPTHTPCDELYLGCAGRPCLSMLTD